MPPCPLCGCASSVRRTESLWWHHGFRRWSELCICEACSYCFGNFIGVGASASDTVCERSEQGREASETVAAHNAPEINDGQAQSA